MQPCLLARLCYLTGRKKSVNDDNRSSEIEAQAFFSSAYRKAEEKYGRRAASLGWLRHIWADIGRRRGSHWKWERDNLPEWHREPVPEQREALDLEPDQTVRQAVKEAATFGLTLAADFAFHELREYGIGVAGSFSKAIEPGAKVFAEAIGTIHHTGYDGENEVNVLHLEMTAEEEQQEKEGLPLNIWMEMNYSPDEEAARRHDYCVQYSQKGFRYIKRPDDGSVPPMWVDEEY